MFTLQQILEYCLAKPGAYEDFPFGPEPICVRVEKRIFAELYPTRGWFTLKCEPMQGLVWREQFPDVIRRGYHCPSVQQPYHNTILLANHISPGILHAMMDHSYHRALFSLTKAARARVEALQETNSREP